MMNRQSTLCFAALVGAMVLFTSTATLAKDEPAPVNALNFARAETDMYLASTVKRGGFGKLTHNRMSTPIDKQDVVRMNRDTLYSAAVFDLDAAPVTITLPDVGKRFMSLLVVNQDHYALETVYAPKKLTYTREKAGTRYIIAVIRTLVNANDPDDVKAANAAQDGVQIEQAKMGAFEVPNWDPATQKKAREALLALNALGGLMDNRFGRRDEVDPVSWLVGTAAGWGGNPLRDAVYVPVFPNQNDGKTAHRLSVKDVPVDGFWSISMYNAEGFFFKNDFNAHSFNNLTAKPNADGSYTIQFGGDPKAAPNFLPITPGWNYVVRLYRPRKEILDGTWKFPLAEPIK
jgi:hypothetical protein